ncbi:MAG TPA: NADH:ubiquinone reductase (Na(+)-transporting) subunit D [Candidatus Marinimicrobia bacterium]|jgi:Na+-transporting NADH:ubiquinone oxidoreductase subunit D|nr:NADH:ubiquinone reductase (Na(+)-transporting) subunit D [Candidatus Neomarinimicrobiota bacterium]MDP6230433.1 NADH:ubiquinone reductase (Na(+)-transporting) subunit D [Candidatus Neomarinimicrobiota bacterium]MDP7094588.1 NADH:ubiquinone reductase (Na(+)-transporting) subunit D [Candidatus Neomarinimicrobiota bacterium]MDP7512776.1 NADH:ubiquinone reductase (Na(+)-transporting) subunit D [Candidatus Neomarinimicrobiota bacterium]HBR86949.1 NADH:ubiquinone reductase (Na(+)-transporting) sub|tara:strand:+ start:5228 stop:5854 length:627 start_codon:yes stop_codon:yes gene_type:complete
MALLNKKSQVVLKDPLMNNNPITFQVLGICSALAVTVKVDTAIIMTLAVVFVLSMSNTLISLLRNFIPTRVRIIVQLAIIASLVILTDQVLRAYMYEMSKQLSVFVGLIITNCIVMGRAEAFAMQNKPGQSFLDGLGNGLGYGIILIAVSIFREILGSGTLYGFQVIPSAFYDSGYVNNGLMVLSPGAFIILGLIIWIQRTVFDIEEN